MPSPELSIIIVSYNTRELLAGCLRSVQRVADEANMEIILVDNSSTDGSADYVEREFPNVKVLRQERNRGFAAGMNAGIAAANAALFMALNPDAILVPGAIRNLMTFMKEHSSAGVAGAVLTHPDGTLQTSAFRFPSLFREFWNFLPEVKHLLKRDPTWSGFAVAEGRRVPISVDAVSGAALMARTLAVREIGGFDEKFFLYHEEMDLCTSLRKSGWSVWLVPDVQVIHLDARSSGYRRDRLAAMPVLEWRIMGMDRLWAKHKSAAQHAIWRLMARSLLRLRIVLLSPCVIVSSNCRGRIGELVSIANLLNNKWKAER